MAKPASSRGKVGKPAAVRESLKESPSRSGKKRKAAAPRPRWPEIAVVVVLALVVILGAVALFRHLSRGDSKAIAKNAKAAVTDHGDDDESADRPKKSSDRLEEGDDPVDRRSGGGDSGDEKAPEGALNADPSSEPPADPPAAQPEATPSANPTTPATTPTATPADPPKPPDKPPATAENTKPADPPKEEPKAPTGPFRDLGSTLAIPPLTGDGAVAAGQEVPVGKIYVKDDDSLIVDLLGKDTVLGKAGKFSVTAPRNDGLARQWKVQFFDAAHKTTSDVADLSIKEDNLLFAWRNVEDKGSAERLRNCLLEISVGPKTQAVSLRTPLEIAPLIVEVSPKPVTVEVTVPGLPTDDSLLQLDITRVSEQFGQKIKYEPDHVIAPKAKSNIAILGEDDRPLVYFSVEFTRARDKLTVQCKPMISAGKGGLIPFNKKKFEQQNNLSQIQAQIDQLNAWLAKVPEEMGKAKDEAAKQKITIAEKDWKDRVAAGEKFKKNVELVNKIMAEIDKNGAIEFSIFLKFGDQPSEIVRTRSLAAAGPAGAPQGAGK